MSEEKSRHRATAATTSSSVVMDPVDEQLDTWLQRLADELAHNERVAGDPHASPDTLHDRVDAASRVLVAALPWLDSSTLTVDRRRVLVAHVDRLRRSTEQLADEQRRATVAAETTRRALRLADRLHFAADASLYTFPLSLRPAISALETLKVCLIVRDDSWVKFRHCLMST